MKKISRIIIAVFLAFSLLSTNAFAVETMDHKTVGEEIFNQKAFEGQGGVNPEIDGDETEIVLNYLLGDDLTLEEKQRLYEKALYGGFEFGANPELDALNLGTPRRAAAQTTYPDYALWTRAVMQETKDWCSAATIQIVLRYLKDPEYQTVDAFNVSQQAIMNAVGNGPSLQTVINYVNARLPVGCSKYVRKVYGGDEATFDSLLSWSVWNYQPMIFTMSNKYYKRFWPYRTDGHFVVCEGFYKTTDQYRFSDPYYFRKYVDNPVTEVGKFCRTFEELNLASAELHNPGNQAVGY